MSHNTTSSFGHSVIHLNEVTSTNDLAKQLIAENLAGHGTLIRADYQSKGRGQEISSWESERGLNLLCSIILFPHLPVQNQVYLNLTIALAVYDWVMLTLPDALSVKVKWPNDVYVGNQKLGGILVENGIQGNEIKHSVVGIGINVNQQRFSISKACSISGLTGNQYNLNEAASSLVECIKVRYFQLEQQQFNLLWEDYHQVLYKKEVDSSFLHKGEIIHGIPKGIDKSGRLRLMLNGFEHCFQVKELIWI